jgi:hypothetical protein
MRNGEVREVIDRRRILGTADLANWLEKGKWIARRTGFKSPPNPPLLKGGGRGFQIFMVRG